jgi:hypothetical protein
MNISELKVFGFETALWCLKHGLRVERKGWNGKGMWLALCTTSSFYDIPFNPDWSAGRQNLPFVVMKTADDHLVPWLASQTDLLSEDWILVK